MSIGYLYELLPEVALNETRTIEILDNSYGLPNGTYTFAEGFCDDIDCDCRRAYFFVYYKKESKIEYEKEPYAFISYGFASKKFYNEWMFGNESEETLNQMMIPTLDMLNYQSKYANQILLLFNELLLPNKEYMDRVKRHYRAFKKIVNNKTIIINNNKISRNELCSCGSGKKYKKCCGNNK